MPSKPNELHIIGWDEASEETHHVIFDMNKNTFTKIREFCGICRSFCHHIISENKLIYIANCTHPKQHGQDEEKKGEQQKEKEIGIYELDTLDDKIEWKFITKLPENVHVFTPIMGYDQILFLFEYNTFEIWCLDLVHLKWFKSHKYCFINDIRSIDLVKTSDNYIHAIQIG